MPFSCKNGQAEETKTGKFEPLYFDASHQKKS
jgi:hypothetical protein